MKTYKTEKELYHAVLEAALLDGTGSQFDVGWDGASRTVLIG